MIIGRTLCHLEMSTNQSPSEKVILHCPLRIKQETSCRKPAVFNILSRRGGGEER